MLVRVVLAFWLPLASFRHPIPGRLLTPENASEAAGLGQAEDAAGRVRDAVVDATVEESLSKSEALY